MNHKTLLAITEQRVKKEMSHTLHNWQEIMGAKHTSDLIPLCHPIPIDGVNVGINRSGIRYFHPSHRSHDLENRCEMGGFDGHFCISFDLI